VPDKSAGLTQTWEPGFRHSAGQLGGQFIRAMRNGSLLGWKTERLGVTVPPIEAGGEGEWVEVGPGATLVGYAPPADLGPEGHGRDEVFAAVSVDGADTVLYALLRCSNPDGLSAGARLEAVFAEVPEGGMVVPMFQPVGAA
jgi:uncharacterized OB-fold protein